MNSNLIRFEEILQVIATIIFIMAIIRLINLEVKRRRCIRMTKAFLHIKQTKKKEIVELLTNDDIDIAEITNLLDADIRFFDYRCKTILQHELVKIKQHYEVNPRNWKLFQKLLNCNN